MTTETEHPNPNKWWWHRRIMAYISLSAILLTLAVSLFGTIAVAAAPLIEGICWILGFIVAAYYTNNAIEAFARVRK